MTPSQAAKEIDKRMAKIQSAIARDVPRRVGKIAADFYRESFIRQGFMNNGLHKWQPAKRTLGGKDTNSRYPTLLSKRKELYSSIHFIPAIGRVTIRSDKPYSRIHNYGGTTHPTVTPKMRKWAWANAYRAAGGVKTNKRSGYQSQGWSEAKSKEVAFYRAIALTKKTTLTVNIPQRQFMGHSPELNHLIKADTVEYVKKIMQQ